MWIRIAYQYGPKTHLFEYVWRDDALGDPSPTIQEELAEEHAPREGTYHATVSVAEGLPKAIKDRLSATAYDQIDRANTVLDRINAVPTVEEPKPEPELNPNASKRWFILTDEGLACVYVRCKEMNGVDKLRVEMDGSSERSYYPADSWPENAAIRDFFVTKAVLVGGRMLVDRENIRRDLAFLEPLSK